MPAAQDRDQGTGIREQKNSKAANRPASEGAGEKSGAGAAAATEVQSAELDGNVVLLEQPAAETGAQPPPPLRATAGKAVYEGQGEWLHLTMSPRVENDGMELTAEKVDMSQQSGDAFAHGDVKATWTGAAANDGARGGAGSAGARSGGAGKKRCKRQNGRGRSDVGRQGACACGCSGGATEPVERRGDFSWPRANVAADKLCERPVIVLNQRLQTLVARSSDPAEPVRVVMLSAGGTDTGRGTGGTGAGGNGPNRTEGQSAGQTGASNAGAAASVIRVRGGELKYFDAERKAVMHEAHWARWLRRRARQHLRPMQWNCC
ncbi:MAG: hypothetical protein WDM87_04805 [Terracidiphilus sp.]